MKAVTADEFVHRVFEIAEEMGLRVEERRPGKSICFNPNSDKWLDEGRVLALYPKILNGEISDSQINAMIEAVAPGRPCTHVGMRSIVRRLIDEGGWVPAVGG